MQISKPQKNPVAICWGFLMNQQCISSMWVESTTLILSMIWITMTSASSLNLVKDTHRVTEQWLGVIFRVVNHPVNTEIKSVDTDNYY